MTLLNIKKQKNGFTLVELVLIIGLITIMSIGIYVKYRTMSVSNNIQLQIQDLYAINNKITGAYQSSTSLATLDNTSAIAGSLVPADLVISNSNIMSRFGTTITLLPTIVAASPSYEIKINNINNNVCGLIGTSKFANEVDEVWIDGVSQKSTGKPLNFSNIDSITNACRNATNISFRNRMFYSIPPNDYVQTRPTQTNKYYIPTIATAVNSVAPSCSGNTSWNGDSSFCSCPAGTEWDGFQCSDNTKGKNCIYGTSAVQGAMNDNCSLLPQTKAQTTVYDGNNFVVENNSYYSTVTPTTRATCDAAAGYWDATTNICGGILPTKVATTKSSSTPLYLSGRYIPQAYNPKITNVTTEQSSANKCANSGGNWDGKVCNFCPTPTTIEGVNTAIVNAKTGTSVVGNMTNNPVGNPNQNNGHATSSSWNVDRCVTPGVNW